MENKMIVKYDLLSRSDYVTANEFIKKHKDKLEEFKSKIENLLKHVVFEDGKNEIHFVLLTPKYGNDFKIYIEKSARNESVIKLFKENYPEFIYNGDAKRIKEYWLKRNP